MVDRIWAGAGTRATAQWAAEQGYNLQSSTLLTEDTGVPLSELQAEQIQIYRAAWAEAGHEREPRVSSSDTLGYLPGGEFARFGRSYTGEPDVIAEELAQDAAVQAADTVLLTVPNQLGVDYNARLLETIARHVAPAFGWAPRVEALAR